jgi:hypothetical protein
VLRHLQVHAEATDEVHRADVQQAPAEQRRRPWRNAERAHITVSQSMLLAPYSSAASQEERRWSSSGSALCVLHLNKATGNPLQEMPNLEDPFSLALIDGVSPLGGTRQMTFAYTYTSAEWFKTP